MQKKNVHTLIKALVTGFLIIALPGLVTAEPVMSTYTATPMFIEQSSVTPNILIMLDNSASMYTWAYKDDGAYDPDKDYYGIFSSYKKDYEGNYLKSDGTIATDSSEWVPVRYTYNSSSEKFRIDTSGATSGNWSGNFLNYMTMRRIDIVRKVLQGGQASGIDGSGEQVLTVEDIWDYRFIVEDCTSFYDSPSSGVDPGTVSPYSGNDYCFAVDRGILKADRKTATNTPYSGTEHEINVVKQASLEPDCFDKDGDEIAGVLQKVGNNARWGNIYFTQDGYSPNTSTIANGGNITNTIDDNNLTTMFTTISSTACSTYTPLAETYYSAIMYFKHEGIAASLRYANSAVNSHDPLADGESEPCAKNIVLLLTDGASTRDAYIPDALKDYADAHDTFQTTTTGNGVYTEDLGKYESSPGNGDYSLGGTDYLKDLAFYARTNDLRSDLPGDQNLLLYTVYASFGSADANAISLLKEAARMGGFEDRDNDNVPDGGASDAASARLEWDGDGDGVPDNYYEADDGKVLENQLISAITAILRRASSGTAASVLATNEKGEGNMTQAYFKPIITSGLKEVTWAGYLQSLWIDTDGNLREDTNTNHKLDLGSGGDKIIEYYFDDLASETRVKRYNDDTTYDIIALEEVKPILESGSNLADMAPADRKIFTFIDKNADKAVDEATADPFDAAGELVEFNTGTTAGTALPNTDAAYYIKPYLGVMDSTAYTHLGASHDARVVNLVNYIRGQDMSGLRNRTMAVNGTDKVWKLGDIIHSTPVTVSLPPENFHLIYADQSYQTYYDAQRNRETVIYVGSNDGMLHAFASWQYNSDTGEYVKPAAASATEKIGDELWAYIPQSLLPHLKWLADPDYTHVYYVDMKPKVFDAKINGAWGTFLLVGLRMGGQEISAAGDFDYDSTTADTTRTFSPTYSCLDITDPRNPKLVWERTYNNIGSSFTMPSVIKVGNEWFAVFGSGPTEYSGWSSQTGKVFVVDLDTGAPYKDASSNDWLFETDGEAFYGAPASLDKDLNYNVDAIYLGETYDTNSDNQSDNDGRADWNGKLYRIAVPCTWASDGASTYDTTPQNWTISSLFEVDRPITSSPSLSIDELDNIWVYFGTGRFIGKHGDPDWLDLDGAYPDEGDSIPDFNDRKNIEQQYLFGVKDPFYNSAYKDVDGDGTVDAEDYYHNFLSTKTVTMSDLFDSSSVYIGVNSTDSTLVFDASEASPTLFDEGSAYGIDGEWDTLVAYVMGEFDGWYEPLSYTGSGPSEKATSKSAVVGGLVLSSTYTPVDDPCEFGGGSVFYAQYYLTGTAYRTHVLESQDSETYDDDTYDVVAKKFGGDLVGAPPPSIGIQARGENIRAFVQQSTGEIQIIEQKKAEDKPSGITSCCEK